MATRVLVLPGGRRLVLGSLQPAFDCPLDRPFVALMPGFDAGERQQVEAMAGSLVDQGCVEFCCVGPEAEQLHDSLDGIVEQKGALDVVTTWHADFDDACEYFLFAAGGKSPKLLALTASHPELTALLEDDARPD